ncbi:phospholipase A2 [Streptomyces sp. NPDC020845]|uniref:phospholipase A2 n=1 Tax=Streptomyces sp. NPDC020845 TaxID=3365096 RepID=UPI0037A841BB
MEHCLASLSPGGESLPVRLGNRLLLGAPDKPGGFNFKGPCQRHDFGYRNYKKLNAFTGAHRERIDLAFLQDMRRICNVQPGFYERQRAGCRKTANAYYNTVRLVGKL